MARNPSDGTGPMHVPFGHVVANEKWRGSQLAQGMQGQWAALSISPLLPLLLKNVLPVALFSSNAHGTHFLACILREN